MSVVRWFFVDPHEEPSLDPVERAARNRNLVGSIGLALFLVGFGAVGWAAKSLWLNAVVCGLAAFLIGILIGFLFGVPRSVGPDASPKTASDHSADQPVGGSVARLVSVNTNLEQISDWLTKIIVGVGLVELKTIPGRLVAVGLFIKPFLGNTAASVAFGVQILLYFWSLGFLTGFISTRVFLSKVISDADASTATLPAALKNQVQQAPPSPKLTPTSPPSVADSKTVAAASEIAKTPLASLTSADDISAWAMSKLALGSFVQAAEAFKKALSLNPDDIKSHLGLGICLYSMPETPVTAAISELLAAEALIGAQTDAATVAAIYENLAGAYLYVDPPSGFQSALAYATKALAVPGANKGRAYFYMAAAEGQRYKFLKSTGADQDRIAKARVSTLSAARAAVEADPNMRQRLIDIAIHPDSIDDDLVPLADDPDFQAIVNPQTER